MYLKNKSQRELNDINTKQALHTLAHESFTEIPTSKRGQQLLDLLGLQDRSWHTGFKTSHYLEGIYHDFDNSAFMKDYGVPSGILTAVRASLGVTGKTAKKAREALGLPKYEEPLEEIFELV